MTWRHIIDTCEVKSVENFVVPVQSRTTCRSIKQSLPVMPCFVLLEAFCTFYVWKYMFYLVIEGALPVFAIYLQYIQKPCTRR